MNPRAAINDLLTFQASPFSHLGTSPRVDIMDSIMMNGEGGIRTHAPLRTNGFQDRLVMTLRYLSITYSVVVVLCVSRDDLFIIPNQNTYVNTFFKVFLFFLFFLFKPLFIGLHLHIYQLIMKYMKLMEYLSYTHQVRCQPYIFRRCNFNIIVTTFK